MTISQRIRSWLQEGEDILTSLLGIIIAISGLIAFADVFSNGRALGSMPWLLWIWIVAQAVAVDYQFYITVKRQFTADRADRFVYWTRWVLIAVLGALVVFVGAIFAVHETANGTVSSSMSVLGIPSIAFMYVRAAAPVLLLFVIAADHALGGDKKDVAAPTVAVTIDNTHERIDRLEASIERMLELMASRVQVSEQVEQPALPEPAEPRRELGGTDDQDLGTDTGTEAELREPDTELTGTSAERLERAYGVLNDLGKVTVTALARSAHVRKETAAEWLRRQQESED